MRLLLTLLFPLAAALSMPLHAGPPDTHQFSLDNGLNVLVRQDDRAPVAVVMIWYRVGSIDEPQGVTGMSHMLEHMLFKNTKHLQPGDFSSLVARFGGRSNAFTSYDFTAYFQQYEASRLPLALELEAERMANLRIDDDEFAREVQVVLEERSQRTDDNPNALAWERFTGITRPGTGYAHPIIGWRHEIEQYQPEQAMDWYRRWYSPGNATLVIVGDVNLDELREQVETFFGPIPARPVPARPDPVSLPDQGERRLDLKLPVQVPVLYKAWNVPSLSTAEDRRDYYALHMLAGVLDGGMSARVERNLVRGQRVAASAGANYQGMARGDGLFVFSGSAAPGHSLDDLEAAFEAELEALRNEPPSEEEMNRVRARVLAGQIYAQDSLFGQAMELGQLAMLGEDPDLGRRFADELAKISAEDVQAMARRWLTPARSASTRVQPLEGEQQ